jgi:hypothetical protein
MILPMDDKSQNGAGVVQRRVRPGIKLLFVSLLVAAVSIALFCYSLDLNFEDGWALSDDDPPPAVRRIPLAIAMIGFGVSILVFWAGYLSLARRS